jgi:soluble lytic murein transglycosylase-like protein
MLIELLTVGFIFMKKPSSEITPVYFDNQFDSTIDYYATTYGNDRNLVKAIIKRESNFNTQAHNISNVEDSRGLGQINIKAFPQFDAEKLFDASYNIRCMNIILMGLKTKYQNIDDIISAYNAGHSLRKTDNTFGNQEYVNYVKENYRLLVV